MWTLFGAARDQFSGDAELASVSGNGDLSGNAELCSGLFKSRSRAGRVAWVYYDGREPTVQEEAVPDLPYCNGGSVSVSTVLDTPVSGWYVDSDALDAAFADVPSTTLVSIMLFPPSLLPDINLCTGGNYHFDVETTGLSSVLVGVARDCGADGTYCAVAIDARTGTTLDRQ
ncbi:MAG: hypothetical protein Q8P18_21350 [Pseudomonadota bacterium]|nr:hypothetical protein [Pseudomonadota bacterium]